MSEHEAPPMSEGGGPLRIFCAVELPGEVRRRVAQHVEHLRGRFPRVRASWERAEKLHITLKFFGDVEAARLTALRDAATRAAAGFQPFEAAISGAGAFPPRGAPRVLWLGVGHGAVMLQDLQRRLDEECARAGFKPEARAFHPHVTIARLRSPEGAGDLSRLHLQTEFAPVSFSVDELVVMRSELRPDGAVHTPVSRHILGGSATPGPHASVRA
jgi:2'-5' RNA ligase